MVEHRHVDALLDEEVAIASGIPLERVREIQFSPNWSAITIGEMEAFCEACNFDPTDGADRNRAKALGRYYLGSKIKWRYLQKSPAWETTFVPCRKILQKLAA